MTIDDYFEDVEQSWDAGILAAFAHFAVDPIKNFLSRYQTQISVSHQRMKRPTFVTTLMFP